MEDLPWKVTCVNRITGESRDVPYGSFNEDRGYCNQPEEYKVREGTVEQQQVGRTPVYGSTEPHGSLVQHETEKTSTQTHNNARKEQV